MEKLKVLVFVLFVAACGSEPSPGESTKLIQDKSAGSLTVNTIEPENDDTTGTSTAPVKVLQAKPHRNDYSAYRDIMLQFRNVSDKDISGIKFAWRGIDAFGNPADIGTGQGFFDLGLKAGCQVSGKFSIHSPNLKTVTRAWVTEVAFEDGSTWTLKNVNHAHADHAN